MARATRLPRLRDRMSPAQMQRRDKKIARRRRQAVLLEGVRRDPMTKIRRWAGR